MANQDNKYLIISSPISLKKFKIELKDLNSRFTSFIEVGIDLPTDDLIRVILTKNFSDKQNFNKQKNVDYILNNIDRSYEKINLFSNLVDNLSLEKARAINLKLIKDVLIKLNNILMNKFRIQLFRIKRKKCKSKSKTFRLASQKKEIMVTYFF